jgi:hypothetical protein
VIEDGDLRSPLVVVLAVDVDFHAQSIGPRYGKGVGDSNTGVLGAWRGGVGLCAPTGRAAFLRSKGAVIVQIHKAVNSEAKCKGEVM